MAYRLEHDESVMAGLKRIARNEMESADKQLSQVAKSKPDEAIHESRKSIKKIRAVLRLVRPELGDTYGRENARLRDLARRLSAFRDAFAIIGTFDDLKKAYENEIRNRLRAVRAGLVKRRDEARREEDVTFVLHEAAAELRKAAKRVRTWPLQTDGYAGIAQGLEDTYRAGRKALATVRESPRPENYHELRKRVKDHWYHVRLLENLWTDVMTAYEKSLKDLETWLGDDHNLAVLREKIAAEPASFGKPAEIDLTFDLIDQRQKDLRDRSLSLAERVYEEKPRDFSRRMRRLWEAWQNEPQSLEKARAAG